VYAIIHKQGNTGIVQGQFKVSVIKKSTGETICGVYGKLVSLVENSHILKISTYLTNCNSTVFCKANIKRHTIIFACLLD